MHIVPRHQHYLFAHHLLRSTFFRNPGLAFRSLEKRGIDYLVRLWERSAAGSSTEGPEDISCQGLDYEIRDLPDGTMVALITLPPADALAEAHFIALVWRPYLRTPRPMGISLVRYLTLEVGLAAPEMTPVPLLAEWTLQRRHVTHESSGAADLEGFFNRVVDLLPEDAAEALAP